MPDSTAGKGRIRHKTGGFVYTQHVAVVLLAAGLAASSWSTQSAQSAATSAAPGANDYADGKSWLCRPGRQDACAVDLATTIVAADGTLTREAWTADPNAPIDCFYVYPTVSTDTTPHSDMNADPAELSVVRSQFARFASKCRPYAPLYRQVTLAALRRSLSAGERAPMDRGLGYDDVRDAWRHYLQHDNKGRGFVLIGHSQGAIALTELIRREIDGKPDQARLVSALLLGTTIAVPRGADVGGTFRHIPVCRSAAQTGCAITFASFRSTVPPSVNSLFGRVTDPGMMAACTNPAALDGTSGDLHAYLSSTGRTLIGTTPPRPWVVPERTIETPFVSVPGLLTARCVTSEHATYLEVTVKGNPAGPRASDIVGDIAPGGPATAVWGLHLVDVHLAMGNLLDVVGRQARAYRDQGLTPARRGATIYTSHCAACHDSPATRAPDRDTLRLKTRETILASLVSGTMSLVAKDLDPADKRAVAEYLAGAASPATSSPAANTGLCADTTAPLADSLAGAQWIGWGADPGNTRFQSEKDAGISANDVPRLKLKWAFGFPEATQAAAQPSIAAGRVFVGSQKGAVYSLDAATGCAHWSFMAGAGVRTAISVGRVSTSGAPRLAVFFGDFAAHVYALDAATGEKIWQAKVDDHAAARVTGAPVVYESRLYVPVSSIEEVAGARPAYECCRFRGSVVALDAATGKVIWKTFAIQNEPRPTKKTPAGLQLWGPAGAAIWSSPTIDVKRRLIYVGTGNAYSEPATDTSDAILAIDIETGRIRWSRQITPNDVFVIGCEAQNPNCPKTVGPDFDFGASPILRSLSTGRDILVAGQKSGVVYGLDPDREGALVWQSRAGQGGLLGGIEWGMAADEARVYVPVSDVLRPAREAGGLFALRLSDGEKVWHAPALPMGCTEGRGCSGAQSAAISVIPGAVFSGSVDGHLRAYSTTDGRILWDFDTGREFETVNRVKATGGSIDAAGPVIAGGLLLTGSGYGQWRGKPGNVLLAFEIAK
jgi:polyvinyl alcohol dehydrogenase (cytochrome)